jgi:uncharacterized SAM-dependent methyltransferase
MEMHLRSRRDVHVAVKDLDLAVALRSEKTILTENCRKFTRLGAQEMICRSGLRVARWFSDPDGWFSIAEVVSRTGSALRLNAV